MSSLGDICEKKKTFKQAETSEQIQDWRLNINTSRNNDHNTHSTFNNDRIYNHNNNNNNNLIIMLMMMTNTMTKV